MRRGKRKEGEGGASEEAERLYRRKYEASPPAVHPPAALPPTSLQPETDLNPLA
jgi:hypothetical protein